MTAIELDHDGWANLMQGNEPSTAEELFAAFLSRPAWMDDAACRGRTDINWMPGKGINRCSAPFTVCATCPVRDDCLDFALGLDRNPDGIWGGTGKEERKRLRAQRRQLQAAS